MITATVVNVGLVLVIIAELLAFSFFVGWYLRRIERSEAGEISGRMLLGCAFLALATARLLYGSGWLR